jgi:membrane associated rhomboid family serine protease
MENDYNLEKNKFFLSLSKSVIIVLLIWLAFVLNDVFTLQLYEFGLKPRTLKGLMGIFTMPFLHADYNHLISNSLPLFLLSFGLFYFFEGKAFPILLMTWICSGILTWVIGDGGVHIGASGIVYALAFFMVTVSLLKMETKLLAYTLIIIFLYGSLVWGFFPQLFPGKQISWEGHLAGAITGIILAVFYRHDGPQRKEYFTDEKEEDQDEEMLEEEDKYWEETTKPD